WRSSPDRERPMVRLKRSTAGLNICAGLLWGSVTSPTTSPGVCSSPVASDRFYTLNYDEPHMGNLLKYPFKDSTMSLTELSNNKELADRMDRFIVSLRNEGKHRLAPVRNRSLQGGCGFRGSRTRFSSNWGNTLVPDSELAISYYDFGFEEDLPPLSRIRELSPRNDFVLEKIAYSARTQETPPSEPPPR